MEKEFGGKKFLLTGGAGFIGSHVLDRLTDGGAEIVMIDEFNNYYNPKFKEENIAHHAKNSRVSVVRASIENMDILENHANGINFDAIIHIAARAGVRPSIENPLLYQKVNSEGTHNLLEIARRQRIKKFVFASTSSVYGNQKKVPFSETDPVDNPISPYAATKRATELMASTYHHLFGIDCIGLRFFTVYGERGRPDMAPYLFTEAVLTGKPLQKFGDGTSKRDYTHVSDIVNGILKALDKNLGYEIINLGNHTPVALNEFIATVEKLTGKKAKIIQKPMQPGDVDITYADISKAKKLLGWEPKISFEEGLKRFIEWYKKNRLKK